MMQIISVKLQNAKSYDDAEIEFTPGVNAIIGQNGAGKSTILEAIGLALFDYLGYTRSEFVRAGTRTATVTVTLESNLDQRLYDVVRRVGGSNLYYIYDPEIGTRICEGKADVLAFLREHLGVESSTDLSSLFRDAIGVAQGTFTSVFLGTPVQRKSVFDPLLQVEEYRKAVDLLRPPVRLLDEKRQALEVSIAGLRARLEDLPQLRQAAQKREAEILEATGAIGQARERLEASVSQKAALESVRASLSELRNEHNRVLERQQSTTREFATSRQALADAEAAQELVEKHQSAHDQYLTAKERQKELDALLRERQLLATERAQGEKAVAVAETKLQQLEREMSAINEAAETMERLTGAVHQQSQLEGQLVQARQDALLLKDVENQISRQRVQIEQLSATHSQLNSAMARSTELEARAVEYRVEDEDARQAVDKLRDDNARMQTEAGAIKEQTAALRDVETAVCPVCEEPLTEAHRDELIQRNELLIVELREKYGDVQGRIKAFQGESADRQKLLQQVERDMRDLPRASELERLAVNTESAQTALASLVERREALSSGALERIESLQGQLDKLGDPKREYDLARSQFERKESVTASKQETATGLDSVRERLAALQTEFGRFEKLDADMDVCAEEIRSSEESYRVVLSNQRLAATVGERAGEVERLLATEQALVEQIAALAERLEQMSERFDEEAYEQVTAQEQALRAQLGALETRIEMTQKQLETDRSTIAELQVKQSELADTETRVGSILGQIEVLQTIRTLLKQAGPYVTRVLIRQVSDNARQIYNDIMQDYTRHLAWNEDYGITLEVDGHIREFSQLSGGEQMTAALSVRLALLRELSSIDVAFFDEPTANLDESRRESLARRILEIKGFSQLFVISHDDTFEQATQNLIRVERVDGTSSVSMD